MAMSIVGTATDGEPTGSSNLVFTKPVDTAADDLIFVSLTANKNTWTVPSGFTQLQTGEAGANLFRSYLYYKVAGGSEPTSYTFTKNSDTSSPLAGTMIVVRGCHPGSAAILDSAVAVQTSVAAGADPAVTISVNRSSNPSRALYWRTARNDAGNNFTLSESSGGWDEGTEVVAGTTVGGVRYGAGVYYTGDFLVSTGSTVEPTGGVVATHITTDNVHFMVALRGINEGSVDSSTPAVSSSMSGEREIPSGSINSSTAAVTSDASGTHHVPASGAAEMTLPVTGSEFSGAVDPLGPIDATLPLLSVGIQAETRQFGEHVILVEPDHRAFLVVDDGTDVGLKNIKRSQVTQE